MLPECLTKIQNLDNFNSNVFKYANLFNLKTSGIKNKSLIYS